MIKKALISAAFYLSIAAILSLGTFELGYQRGYENGSYTTIQTSQDGNTFFNEKVSWKSQYDAAEQNIKSLETALAKTPVPACYSLTDAGLSGKNLQFFIDGSFFLEMSSSTIASSTISINGIKNDVGIWFVNSNHNLITNDNLTFSTSSNATGVVLDAK